MTVHCAAACRWRHGIGSRATAINGDDARKIMEVFLAYFPSYMHGDALHTRPIPEELASETPPRCCAALLRRAFTAFVVTCVVVGVGVGVGVCESSFAAVGAV